MKIYDDRIKYTKKEFLDRKDSSKIQLLEKSCNEYRNITLKLELEYKLARAINTSESINEVNEFFAIKDDQLIAYAGICCFNGNIIEISGMVMPKYRRQGIFTNLLKMIDTEIVKRESTEVLILCDDKSTEGMKFIESVNGEYKLSEYEMFLDFSQKIESKGIIKLLKATNNDIDEITEQNAIYSKCEVSSLDSFFPEEKEKQGFYTYLALFDQTIIGKVNIQIMKESAGIFGVGVKPEYRSRGYGREILNLAVAKIEGFGSESVFLQVEVKNENALELYLSSGFNVSSKMNYYKYRLL